MRRFGGYGLGLFFLILDWLLNLHPFPEVALAISSLLVHIPTFLAILAVLTFFNLNHIPLFFPPPLLLLIIPELIGRKRLDSGLQFTVLQLQSADVVLQILEHAAQGVVDLAEVGQQDGWILLMRGRVLVELEVRVSVHLLLIQQEVKVNKVGTLRWKGSSVMWLRDANEMEEETAEKLEDQSRWKAIAGKQLVKVSISLALQTPVPKTTFPTPTQFLSFPKPQTQPQFSLTLNSQRQCLFLFDLNPNINKQFLFMFQIHERIAHFQASSGCQSPMSYPVQVIVIVVCCMLGIVWAIYNIFQVERINVRGGFNGDTHSNGKSLTHHQESLLLELGDKISEGAKEFLRAEYLICFIFIGVMFIIIALLTEQGLWTAVAFLIGAVVSVICGIIGMVVATRTNYRVTYCAHGSLSSAFRTAYKAGCVMGFALVSLGLLILTVLILLYKRFRGLDDGSSNKQYYRPLFESIAGYGLGGSFVALFGRVGGGIYTKAADVGADLVGKLQEDLPEDSPKNPATIADNVGDNVGDVAGMSADLFGSFAESTCAALVISCDTLVGAGSCNYFISNLMYPLLVIAFGIVICILVSLLATHIMKVQTNDKIEFTLKVTLVVSTIVLIGISYLAAYLSYPGSYELRLLGKTISGRGPVHAFLCTLFGLISGLIIAAFTEYITSHTYTPVRSLADSCKSGAASNVTLGLALGYFSTVVPAIFIALTAYFANHFLGYYGVALAALGMLTNLPLSLAIDGYGPISDNAGGIAEMAELDPYVRERTDALDAAGNTTAAIGKGFAIGSAALVSLALYGGFLHNAGLEFSKLISMTEPEIFAGLLIGAMLPYLFSAFTIRSVGVAAQKMVTEIRRQLRNDPGILRGTSEPDFKACIQISTRAALFEMIIPGLLVILTPLLIGFIFGPKMLAGFLPGAIVSGVMMATSAANTGGAWDNAKKYIESKSLKDENGVAYEKGSDVHRAAVVGDTVGDPLKDTSGPALNILMKLMAIISLVFGSKFAQLHPLS